MHERSVTVIILRSLEYHKYRRRVHINIIITSVTLKNFIAGSSTQILL